MADLFDLGPSEGVATRRARADGASFAAEQLNDEQRRAVLHGDGPMLVVAGAGTGKTRVITERIRNLLVTQPELKGEEILGLTFTDKAAGEMKSRVANAVGGRGERVVLRTFHAFCHEILLEQVPEMRVLDEVDHWILLRRNLRLLQLERYRRLAEPGQFLGDFVKFFSRCQDELVTPDDYQRHADWLSAEARAAQGARPEDEVSLMAEEAARQQEIARAYRASDELLREAKLFTFGSLLMDLVRRIDADEEFAEQMRTRFRYVLVDEFQDTNFAQLQILWRLAGEHRNIFGVGDDDQAIYRFRGASFASFKLFVEKFSQDEPGDVPVEALTQNYRSTERILRVANQVISQNERSEMFPPKKLTASHTGGEKVRIVELESAAHEANWVADEIARLHAAGAKWSRFGVLYRAHANRDKLVEELSRRSIPFVIRNLTILRNTLVRDAIAYLRLIATPSDNVAFARAFSAPGWGFAAKDLVRLSEWAKRAPLYETLQEALKDSKRAQLLTAGNRGRDFVATIERLRKRARKATAGEVFRDLDLELDLHGASAGGYRPYLVRLMEFIGQWEKKSDTQRLGEFLEYLDYFEQAGGQIDLQEETGQNAVQLMTVHAAKGLEFDHVFLLRMTSGNFPKKERSPLFEFPDRLMKEERPRGNFHVQEERRLFYVALTRARQRLTLTAVVDGRRNKPSPFLDDILSGALLVRKDVQHLVPRAVKEERETSTRNSEAQGDLFASPAAEPLVFSQVARWAEEYRPPVPEPLKLSSSAIDAYDKCPQKFLFGNLWRLRGGPNAAMTFGNTMHTTIKHFVAELRRGRKLPFAEIEAIFDREWSSAGFEDDYQLEEYKRDGLEQLRALHATMMDDTPNVHDQEKPFELHVEGGVLLTGRFDQVNRVNGGHEIVDYKTGQPRTEDKAKKDLQLSVYALAAREVMGWDSVRLVFHNLTDNSRVATTRDEKMFKKLLEKIQEIAGGIRAGNFEAKYSAYNCRSCEFRSICPAHEQALIVVSTGA